MVAMTKTVAVARLGEVSEDKRFWCHDGRVIQSLPDLKATLEQMPDEVFGYHANEAKNDFSNWVRDVIGDEKLARDLQKRATKAAAARSIAGRIAWLESKR
jgi:hypothetical protein